MVPNDLNPALPGINRADKLHIMQVLPSELAKEERGMPQAGTDYPVWRPSMPDPKYIQVLQGLEAIRRRPAMYIGEASTVRLIVSGLRAFVAGIGGNEVESCEFDLLADGACAMRTAAALAPMGTYQASTLIRSSPPSAHRK